MNVSLQELLERGAPILTSSRRLAHWLRIAYANEAQARGKRVWPTPQIVPWSTWLRMACFEARASAPKPLRLLSDAQAAAIWDQIVNDSPAGQELLNPSLAARAASRSWQRLHQYGIPLTALANFPSDEAQVFYRWAQQFIERTQAAQWLDSARFGQFLLNVAQTPGPEFGLAGFDAFTPEMQALLEHWRSLGSTAVEPHAERAAKNVKVAACADAEAELDDAARWARAQLENGCGRIAVIVPQLATRRAQVQRLFEEVFSPASRLSGVSADGFAFNLAASDSLSRYPLVHSALLCLQLTQGETASSVIGQLLRSPFLEGADTEAAARAVADVRLREERHEYLDLSAFEHWVLSQRCPLLALRARAVLNFMRHQVRGAMRPSEWTEDFNAALRHFGWPMGRSLSSAEQQTLRKFQEALTAFGALDEVLGALSGPQALARLRDMLTAERFEPETPDAAVTIIDSDTVAGMQFDAVWVLGLHAGDWPSAPDPDAFIPIELQRRYGVPEASAEAALALAQTKLRRLAASGDEVVLSWSRRHEDEELRPSPLLDQGSIVEVGDLPRSRVATVREQQFAERPLLELFEDSYAPRLPPGPAKGGARTLELQARCGFRAQAELRLHAQPLRSVSPGVAPDERGNLVHRILANLWAEINGSEELQSLDLQYLQQKVTALAERHAAKAIAATTPHGSRLAALEIRAVVQWVMALLSVERQRAAFRVRRAEQTETFEIGGLVIRIQPDRIDELADGRLLLIDYKTGETHQPSQWLDRGRPGRPARPQLPLYALPYADQLAALSFAVLAPGTAEYRGLGAEANLIAGMQSYSAARLNKPPGVESWSALLEHWRRTLTALAQDYLAGRATVDPLKGECQYCHLSGLCRIAESAALAMNEEADEDNGVE